MVISGHHFSPNVQHVFYPKHTGNLLVLLV